MARTKETGGSCAVKLIGDTCLRQDAIQGKEEIDVAIHPRFQMAEEKVDKPSGLRLRQRKGCWPSTSAALAAKSGSGAETAGEAQAVQDNTANQALDGRDGRIMIRVTFLRSKPRLEQPESP